MSIMVLILEFINTIITIKGLFMKKILRGLLFASAIFFANSTLFSIPVESVEEFNKIKNGKGLSIVKIGADWCSFCKKMEPAFNKCAKQYGNKAKFYSIDADNKKLGPVLQEEKILGYPTILFFKDGKEESRERGGIAESELNILIKDFVK